MNAKKLVGKWVRVKEGMGSSYVRDGDIGVVMRVDQDGDPWIKWNNPIVHSDDNIWCAMTSRLELVDTPPVIASEEMLESFRKLLMLIENFPEYATKDSEYFRKAKEHLDKVGG